MNVKKNIDRARLVDAAMQRIACDTTIENVQLVNVVTEEIYPASVDILDGIIVRVRTEGQVTSMPSKNIIDGGGKYLLPGFIDAHMHVESSLMVPENFGKTAVAWGTTTVVTDPHEIANVEGIEGIKYMIESAKNSPLRQFILAPSCVPAMPNLESSGASFGVEEISEILDLDTVIGIAELMDYVGVYDNDPRMRAIIDEGLKRDVYLQGHAPFMTDQKLAAYLVAGIESDHEVQNATNLLEKIRAGMNTNLKASSFRDRTAEFMSVVKKLKWIDFVSLCTDDVHVGEVSTIGHINYNLRRCIEEGLSPLTGLRLVTINPAREYNFKDLGIIGPGYVADMQLVSNLEFIDHPAMVFVEGKLVSKNGVLTSGQPTKAWSLNRNSVNIPQVSGVATFELPVPNPTANSADVATIQSEMYKRFAYYETVKVTDGNVDLSNREDLCFICSLDRYGTGEKTIALLKDFGLKDGAIATTVSHDNHNITVFYKDPKDALVAVKELEKVGGGVCTVQNGEVTSILELPVAGLMSPLPNDVLADQANAIQESICKMCNNPNYKLMTVFLFSLPAIVGYCITNKGLVSGDKNEYFPIFKP